MTIPSSNTGRACPPQGDGQNEGTWQHLKQAIVSSSGFERWQRSRQQAVDTSESQIGNSSGNSSDDQVCNYLRETLETLAY